MERRIKVPWNICGQQAQWNTAYYKTLNEVKQVYEAIHTLIGRKSK